jgi:hypothetical protein
MLFRLSITVLVCLSAVCFGQQIPALDGQSSTLTLLSDVSSRQQKNLHFEAKLRSELKVKDQILLPQGTVFEGHVEPEPARRRLRQGSLALIFDQMIFPNGQVYPVNAVVTSVELKSLSVDAEGVIRPNRSKKRLAIQLGTTALIAKLDDYVSEVASASVTRNSARYFGIAGAAAFLLLQRGSDVKMPAGTPVDVLFQREGPTLDSVREGLSH